MKKPIWFSFKLIPSIIGLLLFICSLPMKQYAFSFISVFFIFGFPLIFYLILKFKLVYRIWIKTSLILILVSSIIIFSFFARGTLKSRNSSEVWKMHHIDNPGFILPNGLDAADVNKDGYNDYVTNYEWDGKIRIAFHPGLEKVKDSWRAITIGHIKNAESAAFGDFDSDGNFDVVVAHGGELLAQSGVCFIWGPEQASVLDSTTWEQTKDINGTENAGHFHYIKGRDINGDNLTDVVVGGRGKKTRAGLKWIEAPSNPLDRRDLTKWFVHIIDPDLESGHGFAFGDIDLDGDVDIALCNSDWDTEESDEKVILYINPTFGPPEQEDNWYKYIVYQGSEFYSKEQVILYDLSGDNYLDILIQTEAHIYWFKNPGFEYSFWDLIKIQKDEKAIWRARALKIADIDNDDRPDILGMLIHKNGRLPTNKAAVFWMQYSGDYPQFANWTTITIKWGDGFVGLGKYNGEKLDQCLFEDVDLDGDIDIVANCEEFNSLGFVYIAVVWFENPLN